MFWSFRLNESASVARFMRINLGIIELYFLIKIILAYQASERLMPVFTFGICICNSNFNWMDSSNGLGGLSIRTKTQ